MAYAASPSPCPSAQNPKPFSLLNANDNNSFSLRFLSPQFHQHFQPFVKPRCSINTASSETPSSIKVESEGQISKKKRKPRPSFNDQIRQKWSVEPIARTQKLPWQHSENAAEEEREELYGVSASANLEASEIFEEVVERSELEEPVVDSEKISDECLSTHLSDQVGSESRNGFVSPSFPQENQVTTTHFDYRAKTGVNFITGQLDSTGIVGDLANDLGNFEAVEFSNRTQRLSFGDSGNNVSIAEEVEIGDEKFGEGVKFRKNIVKPVEIVQDVETSSNAEEEIVGMMKIKLVSGNDASGSGGSLDDAEPTRDKAASRLPWMPENDPEERRRRSNTELAEKLIPEHQLKRLRNVALRMKERMKVGAAGVTQALVDTIQEKWEVDEVVKLKFEGPPSLNMRRTHQILEPKNISEEELMEVSELNDVLDELGPRFLDWSGRPPLPVDADLLLPVVPAYKTPPRLLPYGVRHSLRDEETTHFRQLARNMAPHFALGRNRELQGLAAAMVKLWEKSAIAKIAIKRGVLNTNNERMAEELKRLTGGTLLSRNKEYIVFYRGNDFLPPGVIKVVKEREELTTLQYQEEEARRYAAALISSSSRKSKAPLVAGTLAETVAATSRWGKQPTPEEFERMKKESVMARRASLMKYLQNKYAIANGKLKKAERALVKVQECLEPEDLPTDLETITDEERLVFRKMGLSMKPHLLLGRREVFDGTIENMHLHWKFRELVKIIVRGKNFAQVKHIAISLEAESGGLLVSIDRTTKGYAIILYRGKNYQRPLQLRPRNLLTRRQALARSIELQRREALKHHISDLLEQMELLKSELEDMKDGKEIDDKTFYEKLDDVNIPSDDESEEDEDEEAYLQIYDSGDEKGGV